MTLSGDCVAYWKLDGDATDSVGSMDGTVTGASDSASGLINHCYSFDGSDDKIAFGSVNGIKSISIWFKPNSNITTTVYMGLMGENNDAVIQLFLGGNIDSNLTNEMVSWCQGAATGYFWMNSTGLGSSSFSSAAWHHLVFVWVSASSTYRCYYNGSDRGLMTVRDSAVEFPNWTSFRIGRGGVRNFTGLIDEVALFSTSITAANVATIYNGGAGLQYPFGDVTGTNCQINIGDAWKAVSAAQINIGDAWKTVAGMKINIGDDWKTIF